jgi:hypothetical protein
LYGGKGREPHAIDDANTEAFPRAQREEFFYLDSPQPIEKTRFGQRNPRKYKLFFLGFVWIDLAGPAELAASRVTPLL